MILDYWRLLEEQDSEKLAQLPFRLALDLSEERRMQVLILLEHLRDKTNYFTSPASRKHHHAFIGGLLRHSLEVVALAQHLAIALRIGLTYDQVVTCGLFHDLGKVGRYQMSNGEWKHSEQDHLLSVPICSLVIVSKYTYLTQKEAFAILYHDGLYLPENQYLANKETPLYLILHTADMWSGRKFGELEISS